MHSRIHARFNAKTKKCKRQKNRKKGTNKRNVKHKRLFWYLRTSVRLTGQENVNALPHRPFIKEPIITPPSIVNRSPSDKEF